MIEKKAFLKELFRKSIHMVCGAIPFIMTKFYIPVVIFFISVTFLYIISELLRLRGKNFPIISQITQLAAREKDLDTFTWGPVCLVAGMLLCVFIFPLDYAKAGMLALAFGDSSASLVGKAFGRTPIPFNKNKTLEGSGACFLAVFITTWLLSKNVVASIVTAFVTMFIEMFPLRDLDNLLIPLLSSGVYFLSLR